MEPDLERDEALDEIAELAFWRFDEERKQTGAERDAFKRQVRGVVLASIKGAERASEDFVKRLLNEAH